MEIKEQRTSNNSVEEQLDSENDICTITHFHQEAIDNSVKIMPSEDEVISVSEIFKILADTTRLKIVVALMQQELCVCDICNVVSISQSAASHQLRVLRSTHLAKYRKEGKLVYYSIDDDHVAGIIKQALVHVNHIH